jgi:hypothetical protein
MFDIHMNGEGFPSVGESGAFSWDPDRESTAVVSVGHASFRVERDNLFIKDGPDLVLKNQPGPMLAEIRVSKDGIGSTPNLNLEY